MDQETFALKGESGNFFQVNFEKVYGFPEEISWRGGYDVRSILTIKSGGFQVKSTLFLTTGELTDFYQALLKCNQLLSGKAVYSSFEKELALNISYDHTGHVLIDGRFAGSEQYGNALDFEFESDQTFMSATLQQLKGITDKYRAHSV